VSHVVVANGDSFTLGQTTFRVVAPDADDRQTLRLPRRETASLVFRASTRELLDGEGTLIAQFSEQEARAVQMLIARYPDAASHRDLGLAIWEGLGYDQYLLHRLMQRVRQRAGAERRLVENVRGAGYRLRLPIGQV